MVVLPDAAARQRRRRRRPADAARADGAATCTAAPGRATTTATTPSTSGSRTAATRCSSVNFRGSTGFGKAFVNAGDREWAGKMHDDLIDAVDWAVRERHRAARTRWRSMGGSYGGYATLVGLTFTPDALRLRRRHRRARRTSRRCSRLDPAVLEVVLRATSHAAVGDPRTEEGRGAARERSPLYGASTRSGGRC
ncbi:MAG: prolyl oligopeptidase family serine peptidase [Rhodopseudomonas palustris]|nr:prolyl oligopeptidase family serine peptidase [Rhodopseudomonas palustris]